MSERDATPTSPGPVLGAPAPAAPIGPTSPPVEPSRSKDLIDADITALREKMAGTVDVRERSGMRDTMHALYQEKLGADNKVHTVIGRDPAAPPEPAVDTGRSWQPTMQPQGLTFDEAKLNDLDVVGRTAGFTSAERQAWGTELARSTYRASMPESARLAQTQTALEAAWGVPKDSPAFQMRLHRATQQIEHLQPQLWDDAVRAGADLDAWVYLALDAWWTKAHPRP